MLYLNQIQNTLQKEIPKKLKKEVIDIRYINGAIFGHVKRKKYNKSHLNKIISHKLYQLKCKHCQTLGRK